MRKSALHSFDPTELMTIVAARALKSTDICFVGIGAPSAACNLARLTHAPGITLIYESGTIGARPSALPLSIGDGELCETALTTVSVPEIFRYWLQGGRISVGFLGGAQIDRYGNLNTTVIGPYVHPQVRLPGAGGAPEIACCCREVHVVMLMSQRAFVQELPFRTSLGYGTGRGFREGLGIETKGPTKVVTDTCVLEPDPEARELVVVALHPGITRDEAQSRCQWPLRFSSGLVQTAAPTHAELTALRDLQRSSLDFGRPD